MKHHYSDIRSRIDEEPQWFDENGTPRYGPFAPDGTANIYARYCCLLLIECQNCQREFRVAMTCDEEDILRGASLRQAILSNEIHYGDPPNVDCCAAGPTMNSVPRRVLEYHRRGAVEGAFMGLGWVREPELERDIECGWA